MVRQTNPRKEQQKNQTESNEIPLRSKRKEKKGKYRHQNNWLEDEDFDEDFDSELDLYGEEEEEDFIFDDELIICTNTGCY